MNEEARNNIGTRSRNNLKQIRKTKTGIRGIGRTSQMKKILKRKESGKIDTNFDLIMGGKKIKN